MKITKIGIGRKLFCFFFQNLTSVHPLLIFHVPALNGFNGLLGCVRRNLHQLAYSVLCLNIQYKFRLH